MQALKAVEQTNTPADSLCGAAARVKAATQTLLVIEHRLEEFDHARAQNLEVRAQDALVYDYNRNVGADQARFDQIAYRRFGNLPLLNPTLHCSRSASEHPSVPPPVTFLSGVY